MWLFLYVICKYVFISVVFVFAFMSMTTIDAFSKWIADRLILNWFITICSIIAIVGTVIEVVV
jgi:hypothetical protein